MPTGGPQHGDTSLYRQMRASSTATSTSPRVIARVPVLGGGVFPPARRAGVTMSHGGRWLRPRAVARQSSPPGVDLSGLVPDPVGVSRDGDMPAFHGRRRVRIGLDDRRPLRRTAAIPSPSSTRPPPAGKLRHVAQFLAAGSAVPAAGGRPAPRFAIFAAASARRLSSMRRRWRFRLVTAGAASRGATARTVSRGTGTPARSHASARCRPSSTTDRRRWRPTLGSRDRAMSTAGETGGQQAGRAGALRHGRVHGR